MLKPLAPPPAKPADAVVDAAPGGRAEAAQAVQAIRSDALFRGAAELQIEHRGSLYRLRQTALGKLILTK
jgi:hemin uptake protein HemP